MSDVQEPPAEVIEDVGRAEDQGTGRYAGPMDVSSSDDSVTSSRERQKQAEKNERPGAHEGPPNWTKTILLLVGLLSLTGVLVWVLGQLQQGTVQQYLASQAPLPAPKTDIVDTQQGKALVIESIGDYRRAFVQESGKPNWLLISGPDLEVRQAALSPDGESVAYTTLADNGSIVWSSLITDTQDSLTADEISAVSAELALCPWTPLAWSPENDRLAFFACDDNAGQSEIVWFTTSSRVPNVVAASATKSISPRDLHWLTQDSLIATHMDPDGGDGSQVATYLAK